MTAGDTPQQRSAHRPDELCTIGEASRITGVATKTIRYYADRGLLPPTDRSQGGYRLFSVADLWRLELVRTLRDLDFGLDEIGRLLRGDVGVDLAVALQRHAVALRRRQLSRTEALLARAESELADLDPHESLEVLRGLTATFAEEAEERRRFVAQAARTLTDHTTAPLWEALAARGVDAEHFSAELTALGERAEVLAQRGTRPEEDAAQRLCRDWLRLLLGEDPPRADIEALAAQAFAWLGPDSGRRAVLEALGRERAHRPGERLLLDALEIHLRTGTSAQSAR